MRKSILAVLSAAGLASFAASNASAMPIAQPVAPISNLEQVYTVCNVWRRCWWRPNHYDYGYYRNDEDDWHRRYRYRYGYDGDHPHYWGGYGYGGYGGWHRGQGDQGEDED
jgi:hypothetical protein